MTQSVCPFCMEQISEGQVCPACGRNPGDVVSSIHQLPPGTILAGRYLLGTVLGEGGFGITYIARDLSSGAKVAVKEYFPRDKSARNIMDNPSIISYAGAGLTAYQEGKEKFLEEAAVLAKLSGVSRIINVLNTFETNNTAYIIMEYVEGITLTQWAARRGGKIPAGELFPLIKDVLADLAQIHSIGLIHRDISPDNMMLENGKIRLLDFGCARETGRRTETLTLRHGYAPVEQYQPMGQGPWTDVYAISATMYFCLTGVTPPSALERICADRLVLPSKLGADVTARQEQVLLYGMGVRPRRRFQSVEAMARELFG